MQLPDSAEQGGIGDRCIEESVFNRSVSADSQIHANSFGQAGCGDIELRKIAGARVEFRRQKQLCACCGPDSRARCSTGSRKRALRETRFRCQESAVYIRCGTVFFRQVADGRVGFFKRQAQIHLILDKPAAETRIGREREKRRYFQFAQSFIIRNKAEDSGVHWRSRLAKGRRPEGEQPQSEPAGGTKKCDGEHRRKLDTDFHGAGVTTAGVTGAALRVAMKTCRNPAAAAAS